MTEVPMLGAIGIQSLRLSPQVCDMIEVAEVFRAVAEGRVEPSDGLVRLGTCYPGASFSNGFIHDMPGHQLVVPQGA